MPEKSKKNDWLIFLKFILPFLLVIAIPLCVNYVLSQYMVATVRSDVLSSYSILLHNNVKTVDRELKQVEDMVQALALNPQLNEFFTYDSYRPAELNEVRDIIKSFYIDSPFVRDVYLYHPKLDFIINRERPYISSKTYYDGVDGLPGDYDVWLNRLVSQNWQRRYLTSGMEEPENPILTYTQSVPLSYTLETTGKINVLLDKKNMLSGFDEIFKNNSGSLCVLDENGQLVMSYQDRYNSYLLENAEHLRGMDNASMRIDGEKVFLTSLSGSENGWQYLFVMPQKQVLSRVKSVNALFMLINLATLVAGLLVCWWMTVKKKRDFTEVLGIIDGYGHVRKTNMSYRDMRGNEYALIKDSVGKIVSDSQKYQSQLEVQKEHIGQTILDKLLAGRYHSPEELTAELEQTGITLPTGKCSLILLHLGREYRMEIGGQSVKEFVGDSLLEWIGDYVLVHETSSRNLAVIVPIGAKFGNPRQYIRKLILDIRAWIAYPYDINMAFGVGGPCAEPFLLTQAYQQAKKVLDYNLLGYEKEILWYDDLPDEGEAFFYPLETENRLYSYALSGNRLEIGQMLDQLYVENFTRRRLSVGAAERLVREIKSTAMRVCEDSGSVDLLNLPERGTVDEMFNAVNETLTAVCDRMKKSKETQEQKASEQIVEYIDNHFTDGNLSLAELAMRFQLNEKYISSLFKQSTGENFGSYVERKRIDKSCELMTEGNYQISEIAAMVGYFDNGTFRRAFKRNKNLSPSAYLQQLH